MRIPVTAALLAFSLLAAGCGDDDTADDDDTAPVASDDVATDDDVEGTTTTEAPAEPATTEPVALTATDTGVSETTITIGVVYPDTEILGRDSGDIEAKFQVILDEINEAGGINGRMVEMVFEAPSPIGNDASDETCIRLVEDEQVFAAVGLFAGTTADCYPAFNDTIVISSFPIAATTIAESSAPAIMVDADAARLIDQRVEVLVDAGELAPGMKVAVVGVAPAAGTHDSYVAALNAAGVDVVAASLVQNVSGDTVALRSEMGALAELWRASGAEKVLGSHSSSGSGLLYSYADAPLDDIPMLLPEGLQTPPSLMRDFQGLELTPFENATMLIGELDPATLHASDEAGVRECVSRFEDATGEAIALDESRDNLAPLMSACQTLDIFRQVAEAAGPELTTESFRAAAENMGEIAVTGLRDASLGEGKFDASDEPPIIAFFNPATDQFEAAS